jgi:hypothetical protein
MQPITIDIPTKAHSKKYLENEFGTPAEMNRRDNLGTMLFLLLEKDSHELDWSYKTREYTSNISVSLTSSFYHRKGVSLTSTNVIFFNNVVESEIKKLFRTFMDATLKADQKKKKKVAIENFMEKMGFNSDELTYEMLKKDYYRYESYLNN